MVQILGVFGTLCLISSAIPEAIKVLVVGYSTTPKSVSIPLTVGLLSFYLFLLLENGFEWISCISYIAQIVCWATIAAGSFQKRVPSRC